MSPKERHSALFYGCMNKAVGMVCLAVAIFLICLPAFSQGTAGRILGGVTDQSGGAMSGATVTILDTARGTTRTLDHR